MSENNSSDHSQDNKNTSIDSIDASSQLSKGYKGNITSKEAGNMVKKMIHDQELELMKQYKESDK